MASTTHNNTLAAGHSDKKTNKEKQRRGRRWGLVMQIICALCLIALVHFAITFGILYDAHNSTQQQLNNLPGDDEMTLQFENDAKPLPNNLTPLQIEARAVLSTFSSTLNHTTYQSKTWPPKTPPNNTPPNTLGAFIHFGKTGGSTISQLLMNGCHSFVPKPCTDKPPIPNESALSKLTTYFHIPDFVFQNLNKHNKKYQYQFLAITTRDPFDRTVSSYTASHPNREAMETVIRYKRLQPALYQDIYNVTQGDPGKMIKFIKRMRWIKAYLELMYSCFYTLDEYALLLKDFDDFDDSKKWLKGYHHANPDCSHVAKATLHPMYDCDPAEKRNNCVPIDHHYWNMNQILFQVHEDIKDKSILTIRKEFLWQDYDSVNRWLGDDDKDDSGGIYHIKTNLRNSTTSLPPNFQVNVTLSEKGREYLCLALKNDYRMYFRLLQKSKNLSKEDLVMSLDIAKGNCGAWLELELPDKDQVESFVVSKERGSWDF
jgi:hypothetical protein